jgi:chromosome segregation ATPase
MPMRNQQAQIRCLGGDMSADSANETEEKNGPGPTDASFALDERTLSEEEKDFAKLMGFGADGNEEAPLVESDASAATPTDPAQPDDALPSPEEVAVAPEEHEGGPDDIPLPVESDAVAAPPAARTADSGEPEDWEEIEPRAGSEDQQPIEEYAAALLSRAPSDTPSEDTTDLSKWQQTIASLENQLEDRSLELTRLRASFEQEIGNQAQESKRQEGLESEYEALQQERDQLVDQLAARSGELVRARDQIEQLSASLRKARSTLAPLPAGEKALRAEVLGLRARVNESQQASTSATARAEGLQTDLAIAQAKLDERDHERDLIDGERLLLASQLEEKTIELEQLRVHEKEIVALCERLRSENQELRSTQIALEETLEARDLEISAREEHLAVTREGLVLRDDQLLELGQERDRMRRRVEELEGQLTLHQHRQHDFEALLAQRESKIATLKATLAQIESALGLKSSVSDPGASIASQPAE